MLLPFVNCNCVLDDAQLKTQLKSVSRMVEGLVLLSFANYIYNLNYRMVVPVMPVVNHDLSNTLLKNTLNTECITLSMLNCKLNLSKDFVSLI